MSQQIVSKTQIELLQNEQFDPGISAWYALTMCLWLAAHLGSLSNSQMSLFRF